MLAGLGVNIHLLMMSLTTCYALHLEYEPLSKVLWVHGIQKCGMDYFFTCLVYIASGHREEEYAGSVKDSSL